MDALELSWPCSRCSHGADRHGYDGVCWDCEREKQSRDLCCTFGALYPEAAKLPFPEPEFTLA
jgi:hypothetical protein